MLGATGVTGGLCGLAGGHAHVVGSPGVLIAVIVLIVVGRLVRSWVRRQVLDLRRPHSGASRVDGMG